MGGDKYLPEWANIYRRIENNPQKLTSSSRRRSKINPIGGIFSIARRAIGGIFLMISSSKNNVCVKIAPSGLKSGPKIPHRGYFFDGLRTSYEPRRGFLDVLRTCYVRTMCVQNTCAYDVLVLCT